MKNLIYIIILTCTVSYSQNNTIQIVHYDSLGTIEYKYVSKFIQIEVHDSIHLEISSYDIIATINKYPYVYSEKDSVSYDFGTISSNDYYNKKDKFENFLKSKKYKFRHYGFDQSLLRNKPFYPDNYIITIPKGFKIYKEIIDDLRRFDFIEFETSNVNYDKDEAKIEEILFTRLLKNAKRKAEMIAKLSNVKLGKIIEINENTTSYINKFGDWYHNDRYRVRSIIVKFSIE